PPGRKEAVTAGGVGPARHPRAGGGGGGGGFLRALRGGGPGFHFSPRGEQGKALRRNPPGKKNKGKRPHAGGGHTQTGRGGGRGAGTPCSGGAWGCRRTRQFGEAVVMRCLISVERPHAIRGEIRSSREPPSR